MTKITFLRKSGVHYIQGMVVAEWFRIFPSAIFKSKYLNIQNCNSASNFVWTCNLVLRTVGRTQTDCIWEQMLKIKLYIRWKEKQEAGANCIMRSLIICTSWQMLLGWSKKKYKMRETCHTWERRGMHAGFWWETLHKTGCLEELNTDGRIITKQTLQSRMGKCTIYSPGSRHEPLWTQVTHI